MTVSSETLHRLGFGGACLVLVLIAVKTLTSAGAPVRSGQLPSPGELDSLHRYLVPVAPASPADDYLAFLPAAVGQEVVAARRRITPPPPKPAVSAILITDKTRVAIIDDQQVSVGSALPGGRRVVEIEPEYVVVAGPGGNRMTLYPGSGEDDGQ